MGDSLSISLFYVNNIRRIEIRMNHLVKESQISA